MGSSVLVAVALMTTVIVAAHGTTLLRPMWTAQLPSTAVPPAGTTLGWSAFVTGEAGNGYYVTTTADHTLYVLNSSASGSLAWSFASWNDNVTSDVAYGRSIASASLSNGATALHVLRGANLHVFDLASGAVIGTQNVLLNGEIPSSIESVTASLLLLQYQDYIAVTNATGVVQWSQPMLAGNDVRTGTTADAPYIALVQPVANDPAGDFGVTVLTAADGNLVYRATYHSSTMDYFYLMVVQSTSVTFLIIQSGKQFVSRFQFDGTELFSLPVYTNIWGYGVVNGHLYLQVDDQPGIAIHIFNDTTAIQTASTGRIPLTVAGQGHIVGEPMYALLAFVHNDTQFHLTGWTATTGANLYNFTFSFAPSATAVSAAPRARSKPQGPRRVGYSADANIMMANWDGQVFVPTATGFHYVDGDRAALDDTYKSSFSEIVFPATALTNNVLVVTSGTTVAAFQLL